MARTYGKSQDLIDFTRASGGTALRRVKYGAELVTNGTFDTDSDWTKGTGWTISGGTAVLTGDGSPAALTQSGALTIGKLYQVSFDVACDTGGIGIGNLAGGIIAGAVTGTVVANFVADTTNLYFKRITGTVNGTLDNISVKEVTFDTSDGDLILFNHPNNIPRIEYDASGNLLGLLVEESRVNLVANSEDIGGLNQATASDDVAIAPDGTQTADKLIESSSNSVHWTYNSITATDNQDYTFSVFAKKSERTRLTIYPNDKSNVGFNAVYDLDTGTVVSTPAQMTTSIQDVGNGWYRCVGTFNAGTGGSLVYVRVGLVSSGTNISYQGDGSSGLFLWGQQLEAGSFPTSYIPTSGSTATRSADVASLSTSGFGYRQDEQTIFVEWSASYRPWSGYNRILELGKAGGTDQIALLGTQGTNNTYPSITNGGVSQLTYSDTFFTATTTAFYKTAMSFKENDFDMTYNGNLVNGDTVLTLPPKDQVEKLFIGADRNGSSARLTGHIKSIKYLPRRLTNTQLQELTS